MSEVESTRLEIERWRNLTEVSNLPLPRLSQLFREAPLSGCLQQKQSPCPFLVRFRFQIPKRGILIESTAVRISVYICS